MILLSHPGGESMVMPMESATMENFPKLKQRFVLTQIWLQSASNSTLRWTEAIIVSPCFSRNIVEKRPSSRPFPHAEDLAVCESKHGSIHH